MSTRLFSKKGFSAKELEDGVEFETGDYDSSDDDEEYDEETFNRFKETISSLENDDNEPVSFDVLRKKMEPLTENGGVLKQIIKHGTGIEVPPKSIVLIHYNGYYENEKEPHDSTYLRGIPFKTLLGDGRLIPGLDLGVSTMKIGEIAKFLVDPEYAFGKLGCPPRIRENATILYEVELVNFIEGKDALEFEDMTPDEQKKAPFATVAAMHNSEIKLGGDFFRRKLYGQAISHYRKMVRILEEISVADEVEDNQRNDFLKNLYLNLAQCYLNQNKPRRAIIYSDLALQKDENNVKGLFRMGKALMLDADYDRAKKFLLRARDMCPNDRSINEALLNLDQRCKQYKGFTDQFCRRMFQNSVLETSKEKPEPQEEKEFSDAIEDVMKKFIDSSDKEYTFTPGYTDSQVEIVQTIARRFGLPFFKKIHNNHKIIKIKKHS